MGGTTTDLDVPALTAACLQQTARLVGKHGPRLPGTAACTAAAAEIARDLREFADSVRTDEFRFHGSFYAYMKILPVAYLAGIAALAGVPLLGPLAIVGLLFGIVLMVCQFAFYRHTGDVLFPSRNGTNVEAVIEPAGKAERELILSGHHDSAPVARIFSGPFGRFYAVAILAPYLFFTGELVLLLLRAFGFGVPAPREWALPFLLAGLPFVVGYFFLVALRRGTPGAGDNLVSSVMVARLGREVAARRRQLLSSTRLRVVSFDAEEAGLRGSSAYFQSRGAELKRLPCVHLNFDSLYRLRDLQVLTSDINGTVRLSRPLVSELLACAKDCDLELRTFGMIFGAGGTDAAESARAGIPSSSIIAIPTAIVRDGLVYHTPRDTIEHIEPAALDACIRLALRLLERLEAGAAAPASPPLVSSPVAIRTPIG